MWVWRGVLYGEVELVVGEGLVIVFFFCEVGWVLCWFEDIGEGWICLEEIKVWWFGWRWGEGSEIYM